VALGETEDERVVIVCFILQLKLFHHFQYIHHMGEYCNCKDILILGISK